MAKKTLVNGVWVSPGQTTYVAGNGKTYNVGTNPNSSVSSSSSTTKSTTPTKSVVADTSEYDKANRINADSEHDATEELASLANQINTPKETTPTTTNSKTTTIKNKAYLPGGVSLKDSSSSDLTDLYEAGVGDASSYRKNSEGDVIGYGDYGEDVVPTPTTTGGGVVTEDVIKQFEEDYGVKYDPNLSYKDNLYMAGITQTQNQELYANKKSARLAYENTIAKIDEEELKARQQAEDANRLAYIRRMFANKDLNQQLALQGITGGATESALLQLASNYGNQVATNNQNLANALSGYSTDRLNAYNQKEQAIADAKAQREQNIANALSTLQTQQYVTDEDKKSSTKKEEEKTINVADDFFQEMFDKGYTRSDQVKQYLKGKGITADDTTFEAYQSFLNGKSDETESEKWKVKPTDDNNAITVNGKKFEATDMGLSDLVKYLNTTKVSNVAIKSLRESLKSYGYTLEYNEDEGIFEIYGG